MKKILGSSVMVGVLVGMTLMCNNVDDKSLGFDNKNIKLANNENKESVVEVEIMIKNYMQVHMRRLLKMY